MYLQYFSSVTPCRKDLDEANAQLLLLEDAVRQLIEIKRDTPMTTWHDYAYYILQCVKGVLERGDEWYSDGVLWIVEARAFLPIWTCRRMLHDVSAQRDPPCAAPIGVVRDMLKPLEKSLLDRFLRRVHFYCKATMQTTTRAQYLHYCDQQLGLGGQWPPNLEDRMMLSYRTMFPPTCAGHDMPLFPSNSLAKAVRKNQPLGRDGLPARPAAAKPKTAGDPANPAYVAVADVEDVQACNVLDQPLPVAPVVVQSVDQTKCLSNVNSNVAESQTGVG